MQLSAIKLCSLWDHHSSQLIKCKEEVKIKWPLICKLQKMYFTAKLRRILFVFTKTVNSLTILHPSVHISDSFVLISNVSFHMQCLLQYDFHKIIYLNIMYSNIGCGHYVVMTCKPLQSVPFLPFYCFFFPLRIIQISLDHDVSIK